MADYYNEIVKRIKEFVGIESVEQPAEPGKPFGPGVAEALNYVLDLA